MAWQRVDSPEAVKPWFLRGSAGFELAPELGVRADEAIFDKISMSAFEGTPLGIALRDCGLISFMICGIATEIGIDPTVRHGADLGFIPIVVEEPADTVTETPPNAPSRTCATCVMQL
jgi:nicotinamidase-related amidase